jgi:hypothetical protein
LRAVPKVLLSVLRRGTQQTAKMNKAKTTNLFAAGKSRAERENAVKHTQKGNEPNLALVLHNVVPDAAFAQIFTLAG